MDMSSFPRMLQFKRKTLPEAQLLRWANWFSQWKFTVKHIKGTTNVLADFLSRPNAYKKGSIPPVNPKLSHSILPLVFTMDNASSSSSSPASIPFPEEISESIANLTLKQRASLSYQSFLTILLQNHGLCLKGLKFHPDYPFLNVFHIENLERFPKEALCFFWYLFESYSIGISFDSLRLMSYILQCHLDQVPPQARYLFKLLEWFFPAHHWAQQLSPQKDPYVLILFRRPCSYLTPAVIRQQTNSFVYHSPTATIIDWYKVNPSQGAVWSYDIHIKVRKMMAYANGQNPDRIPFQVLYGLVNWTDDHPISEKWIEALDIWKANHLVNDNSVLRDNDSDDPDSPDPDDYFGPHTMMYEEDFDPYEDDPSHPDSRWK